MIVSALVAGAVLAVLTAPQPQKLPIRIDRRDRRR
jgi:hypothetical protein